MSTIPLEPLNRSFRPAFALALALAWATPLAAQNYPIKPVRVIVPNAPGSLNDTVARLVFGRIAESLNQPFIIDNRPGAGGSVAAELIAKAPADGYTLINAVNTIMVVNPFLYSKLAYDPLRDFAPVSMLVKISEVGDYPARVENRTKRVPDGAGGRTYRYIRAAAPMRLTMVNGVPTFDRGVFTGKFPGQFVGPEPEMAQAMAAE